MKLGNDSKSLLMLTPLERNVLTAAGEALGASAQAFRAQAEHAQVVSRTHSGVGFVTRLAVPADAATVSTEDSMRLGVVRARHPQLREPAEFLVQLKAGRIASIEAFCHEGMWPADEAGFSVATGPLSN